MPIAEFEEKQYETPANIELGLQHHSAVFAAGQVLESIVGYDAAVLQPKDAPIWMLLGVNPPIGLQLVPNLWQRARVRPKAADLPSSYVSILLQYKRPQYLSGANASQWDHWNTPYYRFPILPHQQDILVGLESNLSARALVRYACAAFWRYSELEAHQIGRSVLTETAFVTPASLVGHKVWTYTYPGNAGWPNPGGPEIPTESIQTFLKKGELHARKKKKENLFQHLRGLAAEIEETAGSDNRNRKWLPDFVAQIPLSTVQSQALMDIIELTSRFGRAGASWFVVDWEIPNP